MNAPAAEFEVTWIQGLAQLKDLLVQLDILYAGGAPFFLECRQLLRELSTVLLNTMHVAHQCLPVSFQLSHLNSHQPVSAAVCAEGRTVHTVRCIVTALWRASSDQPECA